MRTTRNAIHIARAFVVPDLAESLGTTWIIGSSALSEDHDGGLGVFRQVDVELNSDLSALFSWWQPVRCYYAGEMRDIEFARATGASDPTRDIAQEQLREMTWSA